MGFWIFLFLSCLSIPGLLLLFGWLFQRHAPKTINGVYGYRTGRSMKNEDTWQFAQAEFGRLAWRWGLAELPLALLGMLSALGRGVSQICTTGGVLCALLCLPFLAIIWQVERALKRRFDENGARRTA